MSAVRRSPFQSEPSQLHKPCMQSALSVLGRMLTTVYGMLFLRMSFKLWPLISKQQYERWHKYCPAELAPSKPADYVSRRAMKRRRRKERQKQLMMGCANKEEEFEQLV